MATINVYHEIKLDVSAKRMFKAMVTDSHNVLPKIVPTAIKNIEILHGDGGSGTIRMITFPEGIAFPFFKDLVDMADTEKLVCKLAVLEGAAIGYKLESLQSEHKYEDSGDGGCIIKFYTEHRTIPDAGFREEDVAIGKSHSTHLFNLVGDYLLNHPEVCA